METVILTCLDIFHTLSTYFLNSNTFFTQSLLRLFRKIKQCAKLHSSVCNERRIMKFGFSKERRGRNKVSKTERFLLLMQVKCLV